MEKQRITLIEVNLLFNNRAATIAANIDKAIKRSGLNNVDLSYLSRVSITTIHYSRKGVDRNGKIFIPSMHTVDKLCLILCISPSEIYKQPEKPNT